MFFSKEDKEAWRAATRNVRRFFHLHDWDEDKQKNLSSDENMKVKVIVPRETITNIRPNPKLSPYGYVPDLVEGKAGRMDKNSFSALKKGKLKADLVEDLHGMNLFEARIHFYEFIKAAYASKKRSILLITGKGSTAPSKIRTSLPDWINDRDIKPLILAYCKAQQKDGGDGAFYIYLSK